MATGDDRQAVRALANAATVSVAWSPSRWAVFVILPLTAGRFRRFTRWLWEGQPRRGSGADVSWRDTWSEERPTWRERAAYLANGQVFAADYQICRRCRLGWVEQPWTHDEYLRCGLATAGLAALRLENPGLEWHTLGGHLNESVAFWRTVGEGVEGGYTQRAICPHRSNG